MKIYFAPKERICRNVSILSSQIIHIPVISFFIAPDNIVRDHEILEPSIHPDSHAGADPLVSPAVFRNDIIYEGATSTLTPGSETAVAISGDHVVGSFHKRISGSNYSPA